jgi:hypothetical protein
VRSSARYGIVSKKMDTAEIFFVSVWKPWLRCPPCGRSRPMMRSCGCSSAVYTCGAALARQRELLSPAGRANKPACWQASPTATARSRPTWRGPGGKPRARASGTGCARGAAHEQVAPATAAEARSGARRRRARHAPLRHVDELVAAVVARTGVALAVLVRLRSRRARGARWRSATRAGTGARCGAAMLQRGASAGAP